MSFFNHFLGLFFLGLRLRPLFRRVGTFPEGRQAFLIPGGVKDAVKFGKAAFSGTVKTRNPSRETLACVV